MQSAETPLMGWGATFGINKRTATADYVLLRFPSSAEAVCLQACRCLMRILCSYCALYRSYCALNSSLNVVSKQNSAPSLTLLQGVSSDPAGPKVAFSLGIYQYFSNCWATISVLAQVLQSKVESGQG